MRGRRWLTVGLALALAVAATAGVATAGVATAGAATAGAATAEAGRAGAAVRPAQRTPATPLVSSVDTRVGSTPGAADFGTGGGAGSTYPGAVAPFGMVQLSPDTIPSYGNYGGSYTYGDHQLRGFGLTHISGGGCAALGDVPILPTTHAIDRSPSERRSFDIAPEYVPSFSHRGEVAHPGDYRVHLGGGIFTELTAGPRTGAMRLTFPAGHHASVLFNAGGSAMGNFAASVRVDPRSWAAREPGRRVCLVQAPAAANERLNLATKWTVCSAHSGSTPRSRGQAH